MEDKKAQLLELLKEQKAKKDLATPVGQLGSKLDKVIEAVSNIPKTEIPDYPEHPAYPEFPNKMEITLPKGMTLKGDKGDTYILTEKDKRDIASSITVPIVEKVIERTETIVEKPIVTQEIKEVAISDTADTIRNKLELLQGDERLKLDAISGVEKLKNGLLEVMNQGLMSLDKFHGLGVAVNGVKVGNANEINFIGATAKNNSNQGVDVTIQSSAGGITSINTDTTAAQTLTTGTTGTDFAIVDNGTGDHKFNIPSSSASNRGLLTSADWSTFNGKGDAFTTNPLSQFSSTTSAQLAGVISDETGSGALVFANSPTLTTAVLGSSTATTQTPADNSTKLATTAYVDAAVLGQRYKEACKYGTTTALPTVVYANGSSGVGATLTAVSFGAVSFDGSTPSVGDRVLVKNQASTFQNGIYTVTVVGAVATLFVLTRGTDFNQSSEIQTGDSTFVTAGSTLASTTWAYTGIDLPTMGTTAITFAQAAGQGSYTAGNGIAITGVSIAIDTSITVDKTTSQTLTNKTISAGTFSGTSSFTGTITQNAAYAKFGNAAPFLAVTTGVDIWGNDNTTSGVQAGVGNRNSGTSAYSGLYLNNDLASDGLVDHYAFMGLNSSGYTDTTFGTAFGVANQFSIQNTDGPIAFIASKASSAGYFNWIVGGSATTNEAMRLTNAGVLNVGLAGTLLGKILFSGNTSTGITVQGVAVGSSSVNTLQAVTDTFVYRASTDTLTNKTLTDAVNNISAPGTTTVGYLGIPQNSKSAAYTTVMADAGKHIYHPGADTTARTWTIDSNANVAYPIGTTLTFINDTSAGVITIAITSDTMILAGAGTTGSRTLAANGIATAVKMTSTRWIINGTGLT